MTRKGRNALPRYVLAKRIAGGGMAYFLNPPSWARRKGCPVAAEPLGSEYGRMRERAGELLRAFDDWRTEGRASLVPKGPDIGTFDWLIREYEASRQYREDLSPKAQYDYGKSLKRVAGIGLRDGRRFGELRVAQITKAAADKLYERLLTVEERALDEEGREIVRTAQRRARANADLRVCRRAWAVVHRRHEKIVPESNPFAAMGLKNEPKETPTASYAELWAFIRHCDAAGRASLGTAALIAWEWLQREEDIFGTFEVKHYRPKERPGMVRVVHGKTGEENWIPLYDEDERGELVLENGQPVPLYPDLMARLDAIRQSRVAGPMLVRDWVDRRKKRPLPWPTEDGQLDFMRHEAKRLILAAGLRPELSFTSFRHGGMTEGAESDLTDSELQAMSRHKTRSVLPRYAKRTVKQVRAAARKRLQSRPKPKSLSE